MEFEKESKWPYRRGKACSTVVKRKYEWKEIRKGKVVKEKEEEWLRNGCGVLRNNGKVGRKW